MPGILSLSPRFLGLPATSKQHNNISQKEKPTQLLQIPWQVEPLPPIIPEEDYAWDPAADEDSEAVAVVPASPADRATQNPGTANGAHKPTDTSPAASGSPQDSPQQPPAAELPEAATQAATCSGPTGPSLPATPAKDLPEVDISPAARAQLQLMDELALSAKPQAREIGANGRHPADNPAPGMETPPLSPGSIAEDTAAGEGGVPPPPPPGSPPGSPSAGAAEPRAQAAPGSIDGAAAASSRLPSYIPLEGTPPPSPTPEIASADSGAPGHETSSSQPEAPMTQQSATGDAAAGGQRSESQSASAAELAAEFLKLGPAKWWVGKFPDASQQEGSPAPEWLDAVLQHSRATSGEQTSSSEQGMEELHTM